jgi:hypothetical protein
MLLEFIVSMPTQYLLGVLVVTGVRAASCSGDHAGISTPKPEGSVAETQRLRPKAVAA